MFGPRLFRSRRAALLWAAGVVWFACSVAEDPPRVPAAAGAAARVDATGAAVTPADLAAVGKGKVD